MQDFCKRKGAYIVLNLSFSSSNSNDGPTFVYLRLVTICCTDTKVGTQLHIEAKEMIHPINFVITVKCSTSLDI